jgi:hypothetical protein
MDEPLSPAEIAAWARDYLGEISVANENTMPPIFDNDKRVLTQIAETFERICIVTGGRHFATDARGEVMLPHDHIRRSVGSALVDQIMPLLKIDEAAMDYRRRMYSASLMIVLPEKPE